jgi:hypothetical protein
MDLRQPVDDLEPVELEPRGVLALWRMVTENWMGLMQCRRARMPRHESHHRRCRRGAINPSTTEAGVACAQPRKGTAM